MEKRIITISREFGSGGRTIGKLVAMQPGGSGLCQQGLLHLFAGHGQGSRIHRPVHGA